MKSLSFLYHLKNRFILPGGRKGPPLALLIKGKVLGPHLDLRQDQRAELVIHRRPLGRTAVGEKAPRKPKSLQKSENPSESARERERERERESRLTLAWMSLNIISGVGRITGSRDIPP